jgi:transcriptional regulator with XRE-family HTH domain
MNKNITREHEIIRQARISLGFSQQRTATLIGIQIRQYQRLEYGESDVQKLGMRAGLSLCIVLELDPYDLIFGAHPEIVEDLRARRPAKGNLKVRHKS